MLPVTLQLLRRERKGRTGRRKMSRSRRRRKISSKQVPVICAIVLLVGTSVLFFVFICPHLTTQYSLGVPIYEGLLTFFVLASFAHATFKDPGIIPRAPPNADQEDEFRSPLYKNVDINGITVRMKWCDTCKFYRPPRCSHCSICNCCIENFDHHCPWVDNCIGRRNYRFFFLFVSSLSCHITSVFSLTLLHILHNRENTKDLIVSVVIMVICGLAAVPVFGLTIFHMGLVTMGRTTNEQVTGKFRSGHNPFDLGCCNNVNYILCTTQHSKYLGYEEKRKEKEVKQKKLKKKKSNRNDAEQGRSTDMGQNTELTDVRVHMSGQATSHVEKQDARTPNGKENVGRRPESFITAVNQAPRAAAMYSHSTTSNGRDARNNKEVTV